jgi:CRISPR-associated protein Csd1
MILQSLVRLYERRAAEEAASGSATEVAPIGFERKAFPYVIVIDTDGHFVTLQGDGDRRTAQAHLVPAGTKKTSGIAANLLWDTAEYVLGVETEIRNKTTKPERIREQHAAFLARLNDLPETIKADDGVSAVLAFLGDETRIVPLRSLPQWEVIRTTNPLLTLRVQHDPELVCQREAVRNWWLGQVGSEEIDGFCLVTGKPAAIERLHPAIKGVWGAQSSGANIVSFNLDAFNSYGKEQGANASIGKPAAAMYTTALNDLLSDERHRIQVGDASTVFWAEEGAEQVATAFSMLFGARKKSDDPARDAAYVKQVYDSVRAGKIVSQDANSRFHVLALAPNAARVSVRFWNTSTVAELSPRFKAHLIDLDIARPPFEHEVPNLFRLLLACATLHKADNIPPSLGGEIIRAVLEEQPYPRTWFAAAIRCCRAEQNVDYARAAVIKACLNRIIRNRRDGGKELSVELDSDDSTPAYLLGQLFMVLERIQEEAMGEINRTIRDTYWGAAQANPERTFPKLIDLAQKHLRKMRREKAGRAVNLGKLMSERIARLPIHAPFPPALDHENQGVFIIGYYHQRQDPATYKTPGSNKP